MSKNNINLTEQEYKLLKFLEKCCSENKFIQEILKNDNKLQASIKTIMAKLNAYSITQTLINACKSGIL